VKPRLIYSMSVSVNGFIADWEVVVEAILEHT
jgi:hypothetical protein